MGDSMTPTELAERLTAAVEDAKWEGPHGAADALRAHLSEIVATLRAQEGRGEAVAWLVTAQDQRAAGQTVTSQREPSQASNSATTDTATGRRDGHQQNDSAHLIERLRKECKRHGVDLCPECARDRSQAADRIATLEREVVELRSSSGPNYYQLRERAEKAERELAAARAKVEQRDREWILAMAFALGTDRNYPIPIIPECEPFAALFAAIAARQQEGP